MQKKQILRFFILMMLVLALLPVSVFAAEETNLQGAGTEAEPYLIGSADELRLFRDLVNEELDKDIENETVQTSGGSRYQASTLCAKLTADIDLEEEEWVPIGRAYNSTGTYYTYVAYAGTFDGAGHSISGIKINSEKTRNGFIGQGQGLTVKNLSLKGNIITSGQISGQADSGGVVGYLIDGTFENITSDVNVTATNGGRIAGIVGNANANKVTIKNCINTGDISGKASAATSGFVAGIISNPQGKCEIIDCKNTGKITATGVSTLAIANTACVGGIAGVVNGGTVISGCINEGDIDSQFRCTGGISGRVTNGVVEKSHNSGNVIGVLETGGIVGGAMTTNASIKLCYNSGTITGAKLLQTTLPNSNVAPGTGGLLGGVIGNPTVEISDCYNIGLVTQNQDIPSEINSLNGKVIYSYVIGGIIGYDNSKNGVGINNSWNYDTAAEQSVGNNADIMAALPGDVAKVTLNDKEVIDTAASAFDSMNEAQKGYVPEEVQTLLKEAKDKLDEITKTLNEVNEKLSAIPTDVSEITLDDQKAIEEAAEAFDALDDEFKKEISEESQKLLSDAVEKLDQLLVEDASNKISVLPADVSSITLENEQAIDEAAAAFDALSDELKAQIPEESQKLLTDAKAKLEELKAAASKEEPASTGGSDNTPKPSAGGSSAPAPAKPVSLTAVKNLTISSNTGGKKLTLKYAKVKGATSYCIAYKLNNAKKWKYVTSKKTSYVFKKVKKNGTLTVKVQAAVKSGSKTTYGAYSKVNYFLQNKTRLKKAAAGKKLAKVSWKKQAGVIGYQISYSLKKDFSKSSTKLVKGAKKTAFTVKKLKSKKKYFVRIRPYKTVKGKKYYGAWSAAKTVKVK